jgi:hypothetical protein
MVPAVPRRAAKNETTELRIQDDAERLRVLGREHEGLLDKVARRRAARERMAGEIRAATNAIGAATEELADEARRLDGEMHGMLERWLAAPRTTKKERDAIRRLYEYLVESGILTPRAFRAEAPRTKAGKQRREEEDDDIPEERMAGSAVRPAGDRGLLRTLYRKLVEAMHPDRVQDEGEKAARTEAMKEVTVAYQAGDFARLVELERSWAEQESVAAPGEDREARIEALVKAIGELKRQLKGLEKDVRAVRATHEWKVTAELKRQSKKGDPIAKVREQANAEVQPLRDTHAHLRRYEAGEITLEDLLAGPRRGGDVDDDGLPLRAEDLEQILAMVAMGARRGKGRERRELDMMSVLEAIGAVLEVRAQGEIGMEEIADALLALRDDLQERLRPRGKGRQAPTEAEAHARELFHIVETLTMLAGTMRDMALMERKKAAGGRRRR